jgi:hypothetical protein
MRSFVRHGLVVGTCLGALVASAGCEQKKATEYVTGVSTQVTVPRELKSVRIQIATNGFVQFCQNYKVYDGKVLLPRSLGNFPQSSDGNRNAITFSIVGLTEDFDPSSATNPVFTDCTSSATVKANNVRILRRSTQPYRPDHILFLPMALKYSCFDKVCEEGKTCKGGLCTDDTTDPFKLADYEDGMGDGTDGACFSMGVCMGAAIPAVPVKEDTCDFAVAESKDVPVQLAKEENPFRPACTTSDQCNGRPCTNGQCELLPANSPAWTGVNVEITYDGGHTKEILDLDENEGFSIPDPAKPQIFRLSSGLCQMWHGVGSDNKPTEHRITSIRASGTCAPKKDSQAICLPDQLKLMGAKDDGTTDNLDATKCTTTALTPAKSALVLVVDDTAGHKSFFGRDVQDQIATPLKDPAFERTEIGYVYSDPSVGCSAPAPVIKPATGPEGTSKIISDFIAKGGQSLPDGDPNIEGPLQSAYNFLGGLGDDYARRAVVVVGNRNLDVSTCGDAQKPSELAAAQLAKPTRPISTFAVKLTSDGDPDAARTIAGTGTPLVNGGVNYQFNAVKVTDKKDVLQKIINNLATCLYDVAAPLDPTMTLAYANPLLATEVDIHHVDACNRDTPGWTADSSDAAHPRVKVCGSACTDYQKVLSDTSTFTLLYNQVSEPVPLYAVTNACFQKK